MDGERADGEPASALAGNQCGVVPQACLGNGRRALWGEAKCRHGFRRFRRRAAAGQRRGLSDGLAAEFEAAGQAAPGFGLAGHLELLEEVEKDLLKTYRDKGK